MKNISWEKTLELVNIFLDKDYKMYEKNGGT